MVKYRKGKCIFMSITPVTPLGKNGSSIPIFQGKPLNATKWNGKKVENPSTGFSKISAIARKQFSLVANTRANLDSRRITRITPSTDPLEERDFISSALSLKERLKLFEKEVEVNIDLLTPKKKIEQRSQTFNEESAFSIAAKQKTPIQKEVDSNSLLKETNRTNSPSFSSPKRTTLTFTYADYEKTLSSKPTVEETLFSSLSSLYKEAKNYERIYQKELNQKNASIIKEDISLPKTFLSNEKKPLAENLRSLKVLVKTEKTAGRLKSQRSIGQEDLDTILENIRNLDLERITSPDVSLKDITSMREKIEATLSIFIKVAELQLEKDLLRSLVFWKEGNQTKRILPDKIFQKIREFDGDIGTIEQEKIRLTKEIESSDFWIRLLNSLKFLLFPYFILPGLITKNAALMDSLEEVTQAEEVIVKDPKSTFISFSEFQLFMKENKPLKETYWALKYLSQASGAIYSNYAINKLGSKCPKGIKQNKPSSITYDSSSSNLLRKDSVFLKEMPYDNQVRLKELESSLKVSFLLEDFLHHTLRIDLEQIGKISPLQ